MLDIFQDMNTLTVISFFASLISIIVGVCAIIQAIRYNNSTQKINKDTEMMLNTQIRSLENIQKKIVRNQSPKPGTISLAKDEFFIYKLSNFDKRNIDLILELFNNLRIKNNTYKSIAEFLEDKDRIAYNLDFYYEAKTRDGQDIERVEKKLFEYGILMKIDYEAQPIRK